MKNLHEWRKALAEYGALHNKDCCVNDENNGCDVGIADDDCCENIRQASVFAKELIRCATEYFSHDITFDSEEQRKAGVALYLNTIIGDPLPENL